ALSSAAPFSFAALNGLSIGLHPHPEERSFGTRLEGRYAHACCKGRNSNCPASDSLFRGDPWAYSLVANNLQEQQREKLWLLGDANRPLPLYVGMTSHRKDAGTGFADIAAHQQEVAEHLDREHTRPVLSEAHAVAGNHRLRVGIDLGGCFERLA